MAHKTSTKASESLLVELLTEELPPKSLRLLGEAFAEQLVAEIVRYRLKDHVASKHVFATPRRLAVLIQDVRRQGLDSEHEGPVSSNSRAVEGFAKNYNVAPELLERRQTSKGEIVVAKMSGVKLDAVLPGIVDKVIKKLPVSKIMRWGSGEAQFVRPVHGLVMLHGSGVVPGKVLGRESTNQTSGHRFLSAAPIKLRHADDYERVLRGKGNVIASFTARRDDISKQLADAAGGDAALVADDALLDEITALVEAPAVYAGEFSAEFLAVPEECLILSMQQHQKYVPLRDKVNGKLLPRFLFVANLSVKDPSSIVHGNERVLRARLADARFFFDQDRKTKLEDRVERLKSVVYHNKLGSQYDRVLRILKHSVEIARKIDASTELVGRAAYLSKADLLTEMVGEFPELQGIMGREYAFHEGKADIATIIYEHYLPRFAGDDLPNSAEGISVALADKLDTLVGIYGIGLVPTGDKDPFGLRRQALGVVRILVERRKMLPSLDIKELLQSAQAKFLANTLADNAAQGVYDFMIERFRSYLREESYAPDEIDSVLTLNPTQLDQVIPRLEAIKTFRALPEGMALSAANKRIRNILRQAGGKFDGIVRSDLLTEEAEKKLSQLVGSAADDLVPMIAHHDYSTALKRLASLRPTVDEFFDKVMVMADDSAVRANRLALLNNLSNLFLRVADVSRLQG